MVWPAKRQSGVRDKLLHYDSCEEMEIQSRELVVEMKRKDVEETGSLVLSQDNGD